MTFALLVQPCLQSNAHISLLASLCAMYFPSYFWWASLLSWGCCMEHGQSLRDIVLCSLGGLIQNCLNIKFTIVVFRENPSSSFNFHIWVNLSSESHVCHLSALSFPQLSSYPTSSRSLFSVSSGPSGPLSFPPTSHHSHLKIIIQRLDIIYNCLTDSSGLLLANSCI